MPPLVHRCTSGRAARGKVTERSAHQSWAAAGPAFPLGPTFRITRVIGPKCPCAPPARLSAWSPSDTLSGGEITIEILKLTVAGDRAAIIARVGPPKDMNEPRS